MKTFNHTSIIKYQIVRGLSFTNKPVLSTWLKASRERLGNVSHAPNNKSLDIPLLFYFIPRAAPFITIRDFTFIKSKHRSLDSVGIPIYLKFIVPGDTINSRVRYPTTGCSQEVITAVCLRNFS